MARDDPDPDYGRHTEYKRRDRLLAWPKVRELYGISRTTAWRLQKVGEFPCPVQISSGRVGWRESELIAWAASRATRALTPPGGLAPEPSPIPAEPRVLRDEGRPTAAQAPPSASPTRRPRPPKGLEGQTAFEF